MKKTMIAKVILVAALAVLIGCASDASSMGSVYGSNNDPIALAVHKIYEGDGYLGEFLHIYRQGENVFFSSSQEGINLRGRHQELVNRAIQAYEAALWLQPSGTWTLPRNYPERIVVGGSKSSPVTVSTSPPPGGIQALIERAQTILLVPSEIKQWERGQEIQGGPRPIVRNNI